MSVTISGHYEPFVAVPVVVAVVFVDVGDVGVVDVGDVGVVAAASSFLELLREFPSCQVSPERGSKGKTIGLA